MKPATFKASSQACVTCWIWVTGSWSARGRVWAADGLLCQRVLFSWAVRRCRITAWQNRKWLYFPASCSDREQGRLLAGIPPFTSGPSSSSCPINISHFLSWLRSDAGRRGGVNCWVLHRKYKVRDPWWTSLRRGVIWWYDHRPPFGYPPSPLQLSRR